MKTLREIIKIGLKDGEPFYWDGEEFKFVRVDFYEEHALYHNEKLEMSRYDDKYSVSFWEGVIRYICKNLPPF